MPACSHLAQSHHQTILAAMNKRSAKGNARKQNKIPNKKRSINRQALTPKSPLPFLSLIHI